MPATTDDKKPKKKLLIAITLGELGGAQKYVHDIAVNLTRDYDIFIAAGSGDETMLEWIRKAGITIYPLLYMQRELRRGWLPSTDDVRAFFELYRLCRIHQFDIVHLNSSKMGLIGAVAARLARVPKVVFTAHGWVFAEPKEIRSRRGLWVLASKVAAYFQHAIICVSEFDRTEALRRRVAPPRKLFTVHIGIPARGMKYFSREAARADITERAGIPPHSFIAGTIANSYYTKDLRTMISAFALTRTPEAHLVIIGGEGSQPKEELERETERLGLTRRVHLLGPMERAPEYLKAFDAYLITSKKEGLPFSLLEAMAASLPIITTRVGGISEVLFPKDEKTHAYALAIPPGNSAELARAIDDLAQSPKHREELGREAKKRSLSFTLSSMIECTRWVYEL